MLLPVSMEQFRALPAEGGEGFVSTFSALNDKGSLVGDDAGLTQAGTGADDHDGLVKIQTFTPEHFQSGPECRRGEPPGGGLQIVQDGDAGQIIVSLQVLTINQPIEIGHLAAYGVIDGAGHGQYGSRGWGLLPEKLLDYGFKTVIIGIHHQALCDQLASLIH